MRRPSYTTPADAANRPGRGAPASARSGGVGDPAAVEPEGNALGQADRGHRRAREAGGVEHDEITAVAPGDVHVGDDPALVLAGRRRRGDEEALARHSAGPEVVEDRASVAQVVFD